MLAKLKPAVRLAGIHPDGTAVEIHFEQLDDFHPDRLYERLEVFEALRDTRDRLGSQATFAAAAAEVRGWAETREEKQASRPENFPSAGGFADDPAAPPQSISTGGLLDPVVTKQSGRAGSPCRAAIERVSEVARTGDGGVPLGGRRSG